MIMLYFNIYSHFVPCIIWHFRDSVGTIIN